MSTFSLSGQHLDFNTLSKIIQDNEELGFPEMAPAMPSTPATALPAGTQQMPRAYLKAQVVNYGPETKQKVIRLALLLLIHAQLAKGSQSPVQAATLHRLLAFYNREVYPIVYRYGTDNSRLAQLCQPLLLSGKVRFQGYPLKAGEVAEMFSWPALPLSLEEIQALLAEPVFSWAQVADLFLNLKPLVNWFIYFDVAFNQVLPDNESELHRALHELTKYLEEGEQALEQDINGIANEHALHAALANLALSLQEAIVQLVKLNEVLLAGLEAMVEPPATATFALAQEMAQLLALQAPKPVIETEEKFSTLLLLGTLNNLLVQAEHLAALVFWSFIQAEAISGEFLDSSTIQVYQQAGLFVPEETVNDQLEKIADFIQTHFPVSAA
jgi:hypothetical protein